MNHYWSTLAEIKWALTVMLAFAYYFNINCLKIKLATNCINYRHFVEHRCCYATYYCTQNLSLG